MVVIMDRALLKRNIKRQARRLTKMLPPDSIVYIHWRGNLPYVLPYKMPGYNIINTVPLKKLLSESLIVV
jgi:hypothetical protein